MVLDTFNDAQCSLVASFFCSSFLSSLGSASTVQAPFRAKEVNPLQAEIFPAATAEEACIQERTVKGTQPSPRLLHQPRV